MFENQLLFLLPPLKIWWRFEIWPIAQVWLFFNIIERALVLGDVLGYFRVSYDLVSFHFVK